MRIILSIWMFFLAGGVFAQPLNWFGDITTSDNTVFINNTMTVRGEVAATEPMQAEVTKANAKFLLTTSPNVYNPKWVGSTTNYARTVNSRLTGADAAFYFTTGDWDRDLEVPIVQGRYYTFIAGQLTDANNDISILETTYLPNQIINVEQDAFIVSANESVDVTVELTGVLNTNEYAWLEYSTDNWETSTYIELTNLSGSFYTGIIPGMIEQTEVKYRIRTTIETGFNPVDVEYLTLNFDNNYGNDYGYVVGESIECGAQAGVVTSQPPFPLADGPVTIYFNAAMGNGGLVNYAGDIYIHTGVITTESVNSTDWKYVKTEWGENTLETLMDSIDDNLYQLQITSIEEYYGVPEGEEVLQVAMVFRSDEPYEDDNYLEGKNADGSDIFVDVYELDLNVKILSPSKRDNLAPANQVIPVCVEAMENESISLYLNGLEIYSEVGSSITYPLIPTDLAPGLNWVKTIATSSLGDQVFDSVSIYMRGDIVEQELPAGMKPGVNYIDENTVTLVLHEPAAQKQFAFAIGEYSNWLPNDDNYMKRTPDGQYYWVTIDNLTPGKEYSYQYYLDGTMKLADPYSEKILDPWNDSWIPNAAYPNLKDYPFDSTLGIVSVFQTEQSEYSWQIENFTPPANGNTQQDLVVYELLIRDFVESQRIADVMDSLDYLQELGINAIELMPIMEFDGNNSWGYAPNFFFAPDKIYGTENDYKAFIDACHQRNIAVILDVVPNHAFGQCPMLLMYFDEDTGDHGQPTAQNPWFNQVATHPFSVGYDFNHESPYTRQFFKDVFEHWLTEYKIDGFRVDLSKGLTQTNTGGDIGAWSAYDQSRINILTDYYNHVKSVNPNAYFILEHFADNSEETVLANAGCMLWGNMDSEFKQVVLGYQNESDYSWAYHGNRGWSYPNLVAFMESHDEERLMHEAVTYGNGAGDYQITDTLTALRRMELAHVLMLGVPGPKMIWQFGELGYDYSIFYGGDRTAPKPPRWDYWNNPDRQRVYRVVAAMNELQKSDAFRSGTFTSDLSGLGKRMWIAHGSMNVVIVGNMDVNAMDIMPGFQNTGTWYDYFEGTSFDVSDAGGHTINLSPGEYKVFTSVQLDKPFHYVDFVVKDADSQEPVGMASISLSGSGVGVTGTDGLAWFTAQNGTLAYAVSHPNYYTATGTIDVPAENSIEVQLTFNPNGVEFTKIPEGFVYPNPSKRNIILQNVENGKYRIYDLYGKQMGAGYVTSATFNINVENWPRGVYIVKVLKHNKIQSQKIILQ
jgi:1,4-alpha-glucan branching enzyme